MRTQERKIEKSWVHRRSPLPKSITQAEYDEAISDEGNTTVEGKCAALLYRFVTRVNREGCLTEREYRAIVKVGGAKEYLRRYVAKPKPKDRLKRLLGRKKIIKIDPAQIDLIEVITESNA